MSCGKSCSVRVQVDEDLTAEPVVVPSFHLTIAGLSLLGSCVSFSFLLTDFVLSELAYIRMDGRLCGGIDTSTLHGFQYLSSLSNKLVQGGCTG